MAAVEGVLADIVEEGMRLSKVLLLLPTLMKQRSDWV